MVNFDQLIDGVVGKGKYQLFPICIALCMSIAASYIMTSAVFLAAIPRTRCRIAHYDNVTLYPNISNEKITEKFIPWNSITQAPDMCHMKVYNETMNCTLNGKTSNCSFTISRCTDGYVYDRSILKSTVVTEWDLVCDKLTLGALSSSMYYAGVLFGSFVGGIMSDRFGRAFLVRWGCLVTVICGCATAFSPDLPWFILLRFLLAFLLFQPHEAAFTYVTEMSKSNWRTAAAMSYNISFGLGCMILSGIAYFWRNWRELQIAISLMGCAIIFFLSWLLPESPRWMFSQNKLTASKQTLKKLALRNKSEFPEDLWLELKTKFVKSEIKSEDGEETNLLKAYFKRPYCRFMICSNMFLWMVTCMVYYGFILVGGSLPGSIFVNNAIGGLMEFSCNIVAIPLVNRFGCAKVTSVSLFLSSGGCLLSTAIMPFSNENPAIETLMTVLAMTGRFTVSLTFGVIFFHTAELFPTVGRTTAFGLASMAARIGSIISPLTNQAQYNIPWLTPLIYGLSAAAAGIIAMVFPDTRNISLMTTFDEAEETFRKHLKKTWAARVFSLPVTENCEKNDKELLDEEVSV